MLEERLVLSKVVDLTGNAGAVGDTILLSGTPGDDTFTLAASGSDLVAIVDGETTTYLGALSSTGLIKHIEVDGGDGADTLTVDVNGKGLIHGPTITFDGGAGSDALSVVGTPTSPVLGTTYDAGQGPGSGSLVYRDSAGSMSINFRNLEPVTDLVPAANLTVTGTNADNAITYTAGTVAGRGLVAVDNQETIEFANKATLTLNGLAGSDRFNLNNPGTPTGLTGITVNGGDPTAGDALTVGGTAGNDVVNYSPTGPGAGTVAVATLPTVTFSGIGSVAYNGAGGNDTLTVTTPMTSPLTAITFTPGATANQGSVALRQGSTAGTGGTLLTPLSYTGIDRDGALVFASAGGTRHDSLTYDGVGSGDTFTIGGNAAGDQVSLGRPGGLAGALTVTAPGVSGLVVQGVGGSDAFTVTAPLAFNVPDVLNTGVTLLGGGPGASASITGDGSGQLTIAPPTADTFGHLSGDGLGNQGVSLGGIASVFADAGGQAMLFRGVSTAAEADYTPTGPDGGVVTLPGAQTQFQLTGLGGNPLSFDPLGQNNALKVLGTADDNAFTVTQSGANTVVAVRDVTTGLDLLPASVVSADTASVFIQGRDGNDTLTVDSTLGAVAIPIHYDGGAGRNALTLSGGTATADTYAPGPASGSGTSQMTIGGLTQTVGFVNLAPVLDTVAGPLTVSGTNGNDAIAYRAPANLADQGLVSVDDQETIEFANKTGLTINTLNGTDTVSINNSTSQPGLTGGIRVNGGDPAAGDALTVGGTAGVDAVNYSPTGAGAGTVTVATLPTVTFAGIASLSYNGGGGNDALTVTTPASSPLTDITFTPGATASQGSVALRQGSTAGAGGVLLTPLSYTNVDRDGSLAFASAGGTRHDSLTYDGTGSGDTFTIGGNAAGDKVALGRPGGVAGALNVTAPGVSALVVRGVGSNDAFTVIAPLAFNVPDVLNSGVTLLGGGPNASVAVTGDGTGQLTIAPPLGDAFVRLSGDGLGNQGVSLGSIASVFADAGGPPVLFRGASTGNEADYTPTGAGEGVVTFPGTETQFDVVGLGGSPLLFDQLGQNNALKVLGTADDTAFGVTQSGASTVVAVRDVTTGSDLLPASVVSADTARLLIQGRDGNDTLTVDSTAGAVAVPISYDGGAGKNALTLSGGTATADTYAPGPGSGSGTSQVTIGGVTQAVGFVNLAPVLDTVAGPLTVTGNAASNVINYTVGSSTANGLVTVDDFEPIEFSNKTTLTLNGLAGDDTIIVNNPNTPTGLTALTASGGSGNDTLVVNANNQVVPSTGITATTVTIPGALPASGLGYARFAQVRVINAQDPLTGTSVPALAATKAVALENALVASFRFSDPVPPSIFGHAADFVASIDWGDGSLATAGTIVANGTAGFQVFGSHTYATVGTFPITVTVTDAGSTRQFTPASGVPVTIVDNSGAVTTPAPTPITVTANASLSGQGTVINASEGKSFNATVATFTAGDSGAAVSDFTTPPGGVTIDWGDGSPLVTTGAVVTLIGTGPNGATFSVRGAHDYIEEGAYPVTVTINARSGGTTVVTSNAVVADSPPTADPVQPNLNATEGIAFAGPVARFSEIWADPATGRTNAEPLGDFTGTPPTIDWGDGTPAAQGTVVPDPAFPPDSGHYLVAGTHVYADSGANLGAGVPSKNFVVTVTIHDDGGASLSLANTATVSDVAINLTAQLNPASDSGKFHNDAITNVNQPNFYGTSEPFSHVSLFAAPTVGGAPVLIGQTEAGSDGSWSITSNRLADGSYRITATAVDRSGATTAGPIQVLPNAAQGALIIDTVGPRVVNLQFDRHTGQILVTFQDDRSGLLTQGLLDAANFAFSRPHKGLPGKFIVTDLVLSGGSPTGQQSLMVQFNGGRTIRGGIFTFVVHAASVLRPSGVQDLAGNALDGEFYGPQSASGNGVPGGDFVSNLAAFHNLVKPPTTIIGFPHPNDPIGHFPRRTHVGRNISRSSAWPQAAPRVKTTIYDLTLARFGLPRP